IRGVIKGTNDKAIASLIREASGDFPSLRNIKETEGRFAVADVNGNGKSDLIAVDKYGNVSVYEESNGEFVQIMHAYPFDPYDDIFNNRGNSIIPIDVVVSDIITGDFNGDGNADIVVVKERFIRDMKSGKEVSVYYSTGSKIRSTHLGECLNIDKSTNVCVSDVNGDGMSDIFTYGDNDMTLYLSTGNYLKKVDSQENVKIGDDLRQFTPVVSEFVASKTGKKQYMECLDGVLEFSSEAGANRIMIIMDGMKNLTHITYCNEAQAGVAVVSRTYMSNSAENGVSLEYTYGNVLYDSKFHRYFGFDKVSSYDIVTGRKTVSCYKVDGSSIVPDRTEDSVGKLKVNEVSYAYNAQKPASVKERDELTGVERNVEYKGYDKYGNPLKIVTKQGKKTVTQDITYTKAGAWCDSKPYVIKTSYNYGGQTDESRHQFSYDDKGNITSDRDEVTITRYQDYDAFGNFRTIVYGEGKEQRTEKFTFTPSGRHIQSKTNAAGETTLYEWDETHGVLLSETDAYGRKTTYQYDALGRRTVTLTPDGNSTEVKINWAEDGNPYKASYYVQAHTSGMGSVTTWYSSNGLELCKRETGADGRDVYVVKEYKANGTLKRVSMPSFSNMPEAWAEQYEYDEYGRVVKVQRPEGDATMSYSGLSVTMNTPSSTAIKVMNAEGLLESVITNGKRVRYSYYPTGKMKTATPDGGEPVYMAYDKRGNRTLIKEADGGTVKNAYNIFGQLTESSHQQGSGKWITTTYTYSPEGLLKQMSRGGSTTDYLYDDHNRLISKTMSDGVSQSYEYDDFDRMTKVTDKVDGKEFVRSTTYDEYGRPVKNTYPSGYYTVNEYGENGNLFSVKDQTGNELYRLVNANAMGEVTTEYRGGMSTTYEYDVVGRLVSKKSGNNRLDHTYSYDKRGNLASFTDNLSRQSCKYEYDMLNRLVKWNTFGFDSADPLKRDSLEYDEVNNVIRRSNLGESLLKYEDSNHPHALSSINGVPEAMPRMDQNITFTNFNKVESVTEGEKRYALTYGVNEQRIKSEYTTDRGFVVRYYIGSYEEMTGTDGVTTKLCYLPGGAVMMERNGVRTLYYNYTDRLGSIVSTTDAWGNVVERYAYDPWGERLNPENWTENDTRADLLNNRGFTGHEHIDGMSLINMNGRVYDPLLGSFLSVDPLIQAPGYWLNYNRYMYCYGNPLSFVDPSGNSVLLALGIGAAVGVAIGAGLGLWYGYNQGYTGWDLASCAFMGAGIGAIVGALSGYFISSSISSLIAAKTLWNFMQVGASIGSAVGLLGGTIDGLANKADGLELVNYALTGSLIGMAAGAAIGVGCYGIWSYGTSVMASESANVLKLS
ncbi:MAG: VCBS repeat-containing protein, partial [Paludibacteraceae bacterium]|nr:VCBS repeat-containing protein [Paludibacteraceae bacterium]